MTEPNRFHNVSLNREENRKKEVGAKIIKGVGSLATIAVTAVLNKDNLKSVGERVLFSVAKLREK